MCKICQKKKTISEKKKRTLVKMKPIYSKSLFRRWIIDLFKFDRPDPDGSSIPIVCYVANLVDHKSKMKFATVIPTKEAIHVVNFLLNLFGTLGPPKYLQSDNGTEFCNSEVRAICKEWGVKIKNSRPRHPQTNGAVENSNKVLKAAIQSWSSSNPGKDWVLALPFILHMLNIQVNSMLGITPYQYTFSIHSWYERHLVRQAFIEDNSDVSYESTSSSDSESEVDLTNQDPVPNILNVSSINTNQPIASTSIITLDDEKDIDFSQPISSQALNDRFRTESDNSDVVLADSVNPSTQVIDSNVQDINDINYSWVKKTRRKADAFHRSKIKKMTDAYNKKVVEIMYDVGEVAGLCLQEREKKKLPANCRPANVPIMIIKKEYVPGKT
jgi:hypothetical protein